MKLAKLSYYVVESKKTENVYLKINIDFEITFGTFVPNLTQIAL